jgi:hypothetical protein
VRLAGARCARRTVCQKPLARPHGRSRAEAVRTTYYSVFPPLLAILVLVQHVAHGGEKTIVGVAILLALLALLGAVCLPLGDEHSSPNAPTQNAPACGPEDSKVSLGHAEGGNLPRRSADVVVGG